jgi:hypothetical protein
MSQAAMSDKTFVSCHSKEDAWEVRRAGQNTSWFQVWFCNDFVLSINHWNQVWIFLGTLELILRHFGQIFWASEVYLGADLI